ncbi:MAG: Glu/Leu/Phe/Val dehydrogenase dimerization domain-containing protein [Ignavibacteria bacterium]|nr:Glu/Leu/Phe/Val dehydrogenase dimerization domain-containing protein [Ignavibacteria bacterium]
MKVLSEMMTFNHEQIVFGNDRDTGLRAIIAIHDTTLGPAIGGTRMWPYKTEDEALGDVLRLSRGMTYKAAAAGLNLGGAKGVIIGDPEKDKNEFLLRAYARLIEGLHGRFITGEDVGISVGDVEWMTAETSSVVGISEALGGSGDPSAATALGVFRGIQACSEEVFDTTSLDGIKVAIQGLGKVGMHLAELLHHEHAKLIVADLDRHRVKLAVGKFEALEVAPEQIYGVDADIFSPCALGAIINDKTMPLFKVGIVAGAANNQLEDEAKHGQVLKKKGILYAPDFVINAGGLINVADEISGYNRERALVKVENIYSVLKEVMRVANKENITTGMAAARMAERRLDQAAKLRRRFVYTPSACYRGTKIFSRGNPV